MISYKIISAPGEVLILDTPDQILYKGIIAKNKEIAGSYFADTAVALLWTMAIIPLFQLGLNIAEIAIKNHPDSFPTEAAETSFKTFMAALATIFVCLSVMVPKAEARGTTTARDKPSALDNVGIRLAWDVATLGGIKYWAQEIGSAGIPLSLLLSQGLTASMLKPLSQFETSLTTAFNSSSAKLLLFAAALTQFMTIKEASPEDSDWAQYPVLITQALVTVEVLAASMSYTSYLSRSGLESPKAQLRVEQEDLVKKYQKTDVCLPASPFTVTNLAIMDLALLSISYLLYYLAPVPDGESTNSSGDDSGNFSGNISRNVTSTSDPFDPSSSSLFSGGLTTLAVIVFLWSNFYNANQQLSPPDDNSTEDNGPAAPAESASPSPTDPPSGVAKQPFTELSPEDGYLNHAFV